MTLLMMVPNLASDLINDMVKHLVHDLDNDDSEPTITVG